MKRRHIFQLFAAIVLGKPAPGHGTPTSNPAPPLHPDLHPLPSGTALAPWIEDWRARPHFPVTRGSDPTTAHLLRAANANLPVRLRYGVGATPTQPRTFSPARIFRTTETDTPDATLYVEGWCHLRQANRTLRLAHIHLDAS